MEELKEGYFRYLELNNKTQSIYKIKKRLNKALYYLDKNISELNKLDLINWKLKIEQDNYSYSYKKAIYYALNDFFNYLVLIDYIKENKLKIIGNFKNKELKKETNYLTLEEYKKFIKNCHEIEYKILFDFLFFTGCRLGEALALNFYDLQNCRIKIYKTITKESYNGKRIISTPKTKKSVREICIDNKLNEELYSLIQYYKTKYNYFEKNFFIFGGIKPLSPTTITRKKNIIIKLSGVPYVRIHDFRHSHATLLNQYSINLKEISDRLGHSDTSITINTYIHSNKDKEKRTIKVLNSIRNF